MQYKFRKTKSQDIHNFYFKSGCLTVSFSIFTTNHLIWYLYNGKTVKNLVIPLCSIIWDKYV